ncbi:MAG: DHH family phosphoesterase, partial [Flavobacteriales bacterium]
DHDIAKGNEIIGKADLIFTLDYNHLSRVGNMTSAMENSSAPKVMIDHHQQPADYAEVTFSDTSSCSTAQMIYQLIATAGDADLVSTDMAECMYCGLVTDSGSFRFSSVNAETHEIAAHLIAKGLDHAKVHRRIYDTNREDKLKLVGYALCNKLEVLVDGRAAIIYLSQEELDQHNYQGGDTEGLVNQALSIQGVNCAVFIREGKNIVKMSFRSKGHFDVNKMARAHFNGGGHMNAAGGALFETSLDDVVSKVKGVLESYKTNLDYEF